jgi:hypothetical protein
MTTDRADSSVRSYSLKISAPLPIRHCRIQGRLLGLEEMCIMPGYFLTESALREFAVRKFICGFGQCVRHTRQMARGINGASETIREFDLMGYAV